MKYQIKMYIETLLKNHNIIYEIVDNNYVVDLPESYVTFNIINSKLNLLINEKESDRTIEIELKLENKDDYEETVELISLFVKFLQDGDFYDHSNSELEIIFKDSLKDWGNKLLKIEVSGTNSAEIIGYKETPMTEDDIKDKMEKALRDNDKDTYYKYQQMLKKETFSFKFLKNFKNFFE